jgi:hypothetical protein
MAIKIEGAKKKEKVTRDPLFLDEKYTGGEPIWDHERALTFGDDEFDHHLRASLNYYNYYFSAKDLRKFVVAWLRSTNNLEKTIVDKYARTPESKTPMTVCGLVKAHERGMPLRDQHVKYILGAVQRVVEQESEEPTTEAAKPTATVKVLTIQERMAEIVKKHILYFEELEDRVIAGESVDPKAYEYLMAQSVPQAMVGKIAAVFEPRQAEINSAKAGDCEQLAEGYEHLKAADYRRYDSFYTKLLADLGSYTQTKRATKKAAVRKPPAKEKQVGKLKYLKTDVSLKIASINPVDIIGARELWVYNIKTRKLGKYVADSHMGTLGIKGTSIVGFDELASIQKTLRKPDQQIRAFLGSSKVELRKFMDAIKTTEIKLNGRINEDTVLLKVA